jgi:hypothetical protein
MRNEKQRHDKGRNEEGGTQLTRYEPDEIGLIKSVEEIRTAPKVEHPDQEDPQPVCSPARASSARTAAIRSPYAAGRAKAPDNSGPTTPGTKKAKPMNRKLCKMSIGRRAWTRDWLRSSGQRYRAVTIPQAMKLRAILIPNRAC